MSTIHISTVTFADTSFPPNTVLGKVRFKLISSTNIALAMQDLDLPLPAIVSFPSPGFGSYTVSIQRLTAAGAAIGAEVTVPVVDAPPPPVTGSVPTGATVAVV